MNEPEDTRTSTNCKEPREIREDQTIANNLSYRDQQPISMITETRIWEGKENLKEVQTFIRGGAAQI